MGWDGWNMCNIKYSFCGNAFSKIPIGCLLPYMQLTQFLKKKLHLALTFLVRNVALQFHYKAVWVNFDRQQSTLKDPRFLVLINQKTISPVMRDVTEGGNCAQICVFFVCPERNRCVDVQIWS